MSLKDLIQELDIGDVVKTDNNGDFPIESIDLNVNGGLIKLENGINYYSNDKGTYKFIY